MQDANGTQAVGTGHVVRLEGSAPARQRLTVLLETLRGELPVPEACRRLGIGESRVHELRGAWLQEALELLEPRPLGRPLRAANPAPLQARIRAWESEHQTLRQQLTAGEVRRELAEVPPHVVHPPEEGGKKVPLLRRLRRPRGTRPRLRLAPQFREGRRRGFSLADGRRLACCGGLLAL